MRLSTRFFGLIVGTLATGCETGASVTYWHDVAPIFAANCVSCHQQGGIAPFRLDDPLEAKSYARDAKSATMRRIMPPWLVTDDGTCGSYRNSRSLDVAEIETIGAWADAGAPTGFPWTDIAWPTPTTLSEATDYATPQFVPEIAGGLLAEYDEYRCFMMSSGLEADRFITGYEVKPGNSEILHHVLVFPVAASGLAADGRTNLEFLEDLDAASPTRDGWPCFGGVADGVNPTGVPVSWAPGQGVVDYPAGTGVRLRPDDRLVVQVHYNLANPEVRGQSDSTTVRLRLAEAVEREGFFVLPDPFLESLQRLAVGGSPDVLEPGQASAAYTWTLSLGQLLARAGRPAMPVDLFGAMPHMHERGRTLTMSLVPSGAANRCLTDVRRWDFHWQMFYFYEQPTQLVPGDSVQVTCTYDTTDATAPILPGWGTRNEMCLSILYLVPS